MEGPWKHIGDTRSVPYNGSATEKPRISEMIVARKKHRSSMEGCGLMQVYWNSHVNNTEAPWEFICLMDALKNPLGSYTAHGAPMETPLNSHKGRKESQESLTGTPWQHHGDLEVPCKPHGVLIGKIAEALWHLGSPIIAPQESHGNTTEAQWGL